MLLELNERFNTTKHYTLAPKHYSLVSAEVPKAVECFNRNFAMNIDKQLETSTPIEPKRIRKFPTEENISPIELGTSSNSETEKIDQERPIMIKKATVLDMVIEAIIAVGEPRKGASYQGIKKWIDANKEVDPGRLNFALKVAVKKGIDNGILQRPRHSASVVGALGFFMLAPTKSLKSSKTLVIQPAISSYKSKRSAKANKITSASRASKIAMRKIKSPTHGTKIATKASNKSSKKPEVEKKAATKASSKAKAAIKKRFAIRTPPDVEAAKKPATKAPSKAVKKPAAKAPSKAEAAKKTATKEPPKAEAAKKAATKAPSKAEAVKKPATKVPSKAETAKKPPIREPPKAEAAKKSAAKVPSKAKAEKPARKAPSNVKTREKHTTKMLFKEKASDSFGSLKDELGRQELSDTEITIKKNRMNILKSFSSDTELEVSKKEENRTKREFKKLPARTKKVASKV